MHGILSKDAGMGARRKKTLSTQESNMMHLGRPSSNCQGAHLSPGAAASPPHKVGGEKPEKPDIIFIKGRADRI